jgi:hypothetical protein
MTEVQQHSQETCHGYVYFDDPDWWRGFGVTEKCARAITEFRQAVAALRPGDQEDISTCEAVIEHVWEISERVANLMEWHAKKDIAVIIALAQLYEACVDRTSPRSFRIERIRANLNTKAESIRSLLLRMHDVRC